MAKPKSPLLSFGARGTIADSLTFQKRGQHTIAREKPIPKDPYSLAQAYQRWDYQDYAHLWTLETEASKQSYRTRASRYHLTGFSLWMREHLKDLFALAGRWHLDEEGGAIAYDSSGNANDATIIGASPAPGVIDGAYSFDGQNDLINCGHDPTLNLANAFTMEMFLTIIDYPPTGWATPLRKGAGDPKLNNYLIAVDSAGLTRFYVGNGTLSISLSFGTLLKDTPYHLTATFTTTDASVFLDGELVNGPLATGWQALTNANDCLLASIWSHYSKVVIDEFSLRSQALPDTLIKRHSERGYPA